MWPLSPAIVTMATVARNRDPGHQITTMDIVVTVAAAAHNRHRCHRGYRTVGWLNQLAKQAKPPAPNIFFRVARLCTRANPPLLTPPTLFRQ